MTRGDRWVGPVLLVVVTAAPAVLAGGALHRLDSAVLVGVVEHRRLAWSRPVNRLTQVASPPAVLGGVIAAAVWSLHRGVPPRAAGRALTTAATGIAVRRVLAELVRRPRPPEAWWWATPSGFSYPSRHVAWAVFGYGAMADLLQTAGSPAIAGWARVAPPTVVAMTRVLLAVHWPSDVAAAVLFAAGWRWADRHLLGLCETFKPS